MSVRDTAAASTKGQKVAAEEDLREEGPVRLFRQVLKDQGTPRDGAQLAQQSLCLVNVVEDICPGVHRVHARAQHDAMSCHASAMHGVL